MTEEEGSLVIVLDDLLDAVEKMDEDGHPMLFHGHLRYEKPRALVEKFEAPV